MREFHQAFEALRAQGVLHPQGERPSQFFDAAARVARDVASERLPLALGLVMHLYPLAALRYVQLPWLSRAHWRCKHLVERIYSRSWVLANAGGERAGATNYPVTARPVRGGIEVSGTFDYVSLASVADLVLFKAPLAGTDGVAFCAAPLRAHSVTLGASRFPGGMRMSDTRTLAFARHFVPSSLTVIAPAESSLQCVFDYQRCWFHLLLVEIYRARLMHLRRRYGVAVGLEERMSDPELDCLRDHSLRLLDSPATALDSSELGRATAAMKLRTSWLAQRAMAGLNELAAHSAEAALLRSAAEELSYIPRQPTADARILQALAPRFAVAV